VNNFLLPQLTDYFPSGNPLRSCTTASLISYTPNPQPALLKREAAPAAVNIFPAVNELTSTATYIAEANRVEPSPSRSISASDDGETTSTEDNSDSGSPPATSSSGPPPSQQDIQTVPDTPASSSSTTQEGPYTPVETVETPSTTATDGSIQTSNTALGTMTLTGSSTQMAGNSSSSQASTWNYVCSVEGCTLASSSGATASGGNVSSTSTENASQTTAQSSAARAVPGYSIGSLLLLLVASLVAMG
jgi:hypothetical protein